MLLFSLAEFGQVSTLPKNDLWRLGTAYGVDDQTYKIDLTNSHFFHSMEMLRKRNLLVSELLDRSIITDLKRNRYER